MKLIRLHKMYKLSLFLFLLLCSLQVKAIEITDLYQAAVPVTSQLTADRNKATRQAMVAVILKVGGQESVLSNPLVRKELAKYKQYLTKYRYEREQDNLNLVAFFDENKINQLFQNANLPIWGSLRPQILVWLVAEDNLSREVISEAANALFAETIQSFSRQRGLPLLMPLMDLEDAVSVNITDLWGRFAAETEVMSARYLVDASLIIRLSNNSLVNQTTEACEGVLCQEQNLYAMDWSLVAEQQRFGELMHGSSPKDMLNSVLVQVADVIYQDYALSTDLSNEVTIEVANVDSLSTYVDIQRFLTELSAVESVTLVSAEQEARRFKLKLLGSKQALMASLKLNDNLQQYIDPFASKESQAYPIFYWRR